MMTWILSAACACALACGAVDVERTVPAATRTLAVGAGADFATLEAALDRVAEIRKADTATPLAVLVASGDYAPARPLAITRRHAQTNWAPLTVSAVDFARRPRLHGGAPVTNWTRTSFNGRADVWCADVSALNLAPRTRLRPELPREAEGVREHPEWLR